LRSCPFVRAYYITNILSFSKEGSFLSVILGCLSILVFEYYSRVSSFRFIIPQAPRSILHRDTFSFFLIFFYVFYSASFACFALMLS
jgi:hypothetical protein